jgi:chemotaxis protein CheD
MEAKVFGGGAVISGMNSMNVGERNTNFVLDYLKTERIPVVSKDVLDIYPRKVCFLPPAARPWSSAWPRPMPTRWWQQDRAAPHKRWRRFATGGGSIDLF